MRFIRPDGAEMSTWASAAALALCLAGCGQPEAVKSPELVQPIWGAPEAEVAAAETGTASNAAGAASLQPAETDLDAPAPGADGSPGAETAASGEAVAEAAPAELDPADEPPVLEEPKPRAPAKASKSKKKKNKKKKASP